MSRKGFNKKKTTVSMIFLLIGAVLILGFAVKRLKSGNIGIDGKNMIVSAINTNGKTLEVSSDGNISFEENSYFKKYVIKSVKEISDLVTSEDNRSVFINLDNTSSAVLNSGTFNSKNSKGIYLKDDNSKKVIAIKKLHKENNYVYVDEKDKKNIVILISKSEKPFQYKVVLDPGHGGEDVGTNSGKVYEKDVVLKIVKHMVNNLRYNGIEVLLTRDDDSLNSLQQVGDFVNANSPDLFLSVHINFFEQSKYMGIGTYYYSENGFQKDERIRFAKLIQKHAVQDDGWVDRGLFTDRLKVLRLSQSPCALVECGFLSNSEDLERLTNDEVLIRLAKNLDNAIIEYLNTK